MPDHEKRENLTSSLLMVTVASATLRATGVQSSLVEEPIRLSMAPFNISMPGTEDMKNKQETHERITSTGHESYCSDRPTVMPQ